MTAECSTVTALLMNAFEMSIIAFNMKYDPARFRAGSSVDLGPMNGAVPVAANYGTGYLLWSSANNAAHRTAGLTGLRTKGGRASC